ncbi:tyrosine protein phosphatase 5, partial [Aureobasidium melanogenum]
MAELVDKAPELPPPFVNVTGIANFRDIGGYSTSSEQQQSIRSGLVYRCADPTKVQPDGLAKLKELGVKKVFDLRSVPEISKQGPEWAGVAVEKQVFTTRAEGDETPVGADEIERIWCPVFKDTDYGPEQVAIRFQYYASGSEPQQGFVKAYSDIMTHGKTAYKTILTHLAQPNPSPCIIHCTAGKDRTGIIVALLYLLCYVPSDTVAKEYSLTDTGLQHMVPLFTERLLKNPALKGSAEGIKEMISAQPDKMMATIDMIQRVYGSAEGYVKDVVGLNDEQIAQIRKNLLSDEKAVF